MHSLDQNAFFGSVQTDCLDPVTSADDQGGSISFTWRSEEMHRWHAIVKTPASPEFFRNDSTLFDAPPLLMLLSEADAFFLQNAAVTILFSP